MASDSSENTLQRTYRARIAEPHTNDEAAGYWAFVAGFVLGFLSIVLFLLSTAGGGLREAAIVFGGLGLVFLLAGPTLRLPLKSAATRFIYGGSAISIAGVAYFVLVFPSGWTVAAGNTTVIGVYALGVAIIGIGAIVVPLLSRTSEAEVSVLRRELLDLETALEDTADDEADMADAVAELRIALADAEADEADLAALADQLRDTAADAEADEADLAALTRELRTALADAEADEADLAMLAEELRDATADAEADEADLAAQLRSLRQSQARFELYEDKGGQHRYRLRHRNGNIIATSGEGYTQRHNAQKGLESVRRNALGASVRRIESEAELAEPGESFEPAEEYESQTTFELFEDKANEFRWRLRHDNGEIVADSGEGYSRKHDLRKAIDRVQAYAGPGAYLRIDPVGFEIYRDAAGTWRWRLLHRNGNILADSGEGYSRRRDARRAIDRIRDDLDSLTFETYEDSADEHRWRLESVNGNVVADSGEGYSSSSAVTDAVERFREYAPAADALDIGWAAFEIFEDKGGAFRWRLRHRNGNIMADCGSGYTRKAAAEDAVDSFKRNAPGAEIAAEDDDGADTDATDEAAEE